MAKPTARVLRLLEVLQSGGTHRVRDLAARLDVDDRTVRRYVEHLLELDVPVEAVRGRYGGYRLGPGFRLPPLMLTDEEAVAILVGLALLRRSGLSEDDAARRAETKIRRVLPRSLAARVAALQQSLHLAAAPPETSAADTATLLTLAEAARDNRLVAFAYRSARGDDSARVLAPYAIVVHRGRWLVAGMDRARGELRTFRIDRMILPRRLDQTFERPEDFDPLGHIVTGIATAPRAHRVVVRARTTVDRARASLPPTVATVTEAEPGWVAVVIHAESLDWVPSVLARLGCPFIVVEPEELNAEVRALGRLLLEAANGSVDASDEAGR
jgi:predicted DNA-binding transcriptional regulator YafY